MSSTSTKLRTGRFVRARSIALGSALLLGSLAGPFPTSAALAADGPVILDHGHVDAFNVKVDAGQLVLNLTEDVTALHTERRPEDVILKVKEQALLKNIPDSFPGSPSGYVLPLTQDPALLWPGWNTNSTAGSGYTDVKIVVESVDGPGPVYLYTLKGFGQVTSLLESGGFTLPGTLHEAVPAHTHAQWTFGAAGEYRLKAHAEATNPATGSKLTSAMASYNFSVGTPAPVVPEPVNPAPVTPLPEVPAPVVPEPVNPAPVTPLPEVPAPVVPAPVVPEPVNPAPVTPLPEVPAPVVPAPVVPEPVVPEPEAPAPVDSAPVLPEPVNPAPAKPLAADQCVARVETKTVEKDVASGLVLDHGHIDAFNVSATKGKLTLDLKEDVTGAHVLRPPESVVLHVKPEAFNAAIPAGFPGGPSGYVLPLTQNPNLIWPGWDTNATAGSGFTDVKIEILSATGPGTVSLYSTNTFGGASAILTGGSMNLPGTIHEKSPAHTHAQWSFSAKGTYQLTAQATATNPATGAKISSNTAKYSFAVGIPAPTSGAKKSVTEKLVVGKTASGADCALDPAAKSRAEVAAGISPTSNVLANTGAGHTALFIGGGAALLAGGVGALLLMRRRSTT